MKLNKMQMARKRWAADPRAKARAGFWWNLIFLVVSIVISELLRPKPKLENAKPAGLGDFQFPTATEGRSLPLLWGTIQIKGPNVVWWGDLRQEAITEKVKTGMFSSKTVTTGYRYKVGIQAALCRGPLTGTLDGLRRHWVGDDEVYNGALIQDLDSWTVNEPELFGGDDLGNGGYIGTWKFHAGSLTQTPSPYLSQRAVASGIGVSAPGTGYTIGDVLTFVGGTGTAATAQVVDVAAGTVIKLQLLTGGDYDTFPSTPAATTGGTGTGCTIAFAPKSGFQAVGPNGRTPGYRGTCYVAPDTDPILIGNSTSVKREKYEVTRIPNPLGLSGNGAVSTLDANMANVIYEILTEATWGLGIDPSKIDSTSFSSVGGTLATEGNGFSYLLDSAREATEIIALCEEQMDGVLYWDQQSKQFKLTLIRADYDPNTVPELNDSTVLKTMSFSRGSWEDTTNEVRTDYFDRTDEYKQTFGLAQDSANIRIQGGTVVSATKTYPGCKNGTLANVLAWRDLRGLSHPLAQLTVKVDRSFWDVIPGSPYAYTSSRLGITRLPMRVTKIDYGDPDDEEIKLTLVQDVFYFQAGSFGEPGGTGWEPPVDDLVPYPSDEQLAFESPRAINARDAKATGPADNRVFLTARKQGVEVTFKVMKKLAAESVYTEVEESVGFVKIGKLQNAMTTAGNTPQSSMIVIPAPDSQLDLVSLFDSAPALPDLGSDLSQLIYVGTELMLVQDASNSGGNVNLQNVYRGVCDTTREAHPAGSDVWAVVSGGVTAGTFGETDDLDFKLLPRSTSDIVAIGDAVNIDLQMDKRSRRPYPPGELRLGGTEWDSTESLEANGGAPEATGYTVNWDRRDYRTGDGGDEIVALSTDAASLFGDFPSANNTLYDIEIWDDPDGVPTQLLTFSDVNGTSQVVNRIDILLATNGALPTRMRVVIKAKHDDGAETLFARHDLQHDFDVTSGLTGFFEFGALDTNVASAQYTADAAATHNFTLSSAFTGGDVEYRIDTGGGFGSWTTLIAAGLTTGNIAGVNIGDVIEVRHTSTDVGALKQLDMTATGGTSAFAVLYT